MFDRLGLKVWGLVEYYKIIGKPERYLDSDSINKLKYAVTPVGATRDGQLDFDGAVYRTRASLEGRFSVLPLGLCIVVGI